MLSVINKFFNKLNENGIVYCHWKSNERIENFLEGESDLDLLFYDSDKEKVKKIKIVFFDRDGVLNYSRINHGYIGFKKDFKWIPGIKKTIKYFREKSFKVVIVTNQSGIARGYFSLSDAYKLHKFIKLELIKFGTKVDKIIFVLFTKMELSKNIKKTIAGNLA